MASFHDLRVGETLCLSGAGEVRVTLRAKSGRLARLEIAADEAVSIRPGQAAPAAHQGDAQREREPLGSNANRRPILGAQIR